MRRARPSANCATSEASAWRTGIHGSEAAAEGAEDFEEGFVAEAAEAAEEAAAAEAGEEAAEAEDLEGDGATVMGI